MEKKYRVGVLVCWGWLTQRTFISLQFWLEVQDQGIGRVGFF